MRRWILATCLAPCLALAPLAAAAQEDDRDYLTAFLEDNLSGAGRKVTVTGFAGLLSARATVQEITIADDQGIWLTLTGVTMDWSRSALLSGEIRVSDLSAESIVLDRMPVAAAAAAPAPEAGSFALPDLPVSILIDHLGAEAIHLGPTVLGQEVDAQLTAAMALAGGEGNIDLALTRTDAGPAGSLRLVASYANAEAPLAVDLAADEAAGGIAASLLGIPGAPAVALSVKGAGPLTDFAADVRLTSDGADRLAGQVRLNGVAGDGLGFAVDLAGNLAPLFLPDYAAFFGDRIALTAEGTRWPDGRLDLSGLNLTAAAVKLDGRLKLGSDGMPQSFALNGRIADPRGAPVLLPIAGDVPTRITSAELRLGFDATSDRGWSADIALHGLDRADLAAQTLVLSGSGRIARTAGARVVGGALALRALGLAPADPALARALGPEVTGDLSLRWREGDGVVTVQRLALAGADYGLSVIGTVDGLDAAMHMQGTARVTADDLSRFAGLAGRPVSGAGEIALTGQGSLLTGAFDVAATVNGRDLGLGVAQLDQALRGPSQLRLVLARDETGVALRELALDAGTIRAEASGTLASTGMELAARVTLGDLARLGGGLRGSATTTARISGSSDDLALVLDATARDLGIGQTEADRLLAGESRLALGLSFRDGVLFVDRADLRNPQLSVTANGALRGSEQTVQVDARLNNLGLILADFPGAFTLRGQLTQTPTGTQVDLAGTGPGQIDASVQGRLAADFASGDLAIKGTAQAGLVNPFLSPRVMSGRAGFDLRLKGPFALASLSGPLTIAEGRLADPMLPFSVKAITARADLAGGRAKVAATARISSGGRLEVAGSASLTPDHAGDITLTLRDGVFRDPTLYDVQASGTVTIRGPLAGGATIAGRIDLADTEGLVPSASFGAAGGLPDLQHRYEPWPVRETRARAGLVEQGAKAAARAEGRPYALDLLISAPARIFVRGRGLDMELGGQLRLTGTTAGIVPVGAFELIRGRLEILTRRLDLTEATLRLEGAFVPFIRVVATAQGDNAVVGVEIEGPADDPEVRFTSVPDMPDEEVLAQFLFGNNVENLSVLQAVELANAVRTLAGNGGEGMVSKLRRSIGLDNLDVKTTAAGDSALTAGKYLTRNIYSEVTVDAKGQSEIHLNLDLSRSVTVRATSASDGESSLGIRIEKDY